MVTRVGNLPASVHAPLPALVTASVSPPAESESASAIVFAALLVPVSVSVRFVVLKLKVSAPANVGVPLSVIELATGLIGEDVVPGGMLEPVPVTVIPTIRSATLGNVSLGLVMLSVVAEPRIGRRSTRRY